MGLTHVEATVTGKRGKKATVRFLVDSGASYSVLPETTWKQLGLARKRSLDFTLADGTTIRRDVSEAHFTLGEVEGHSPVILGEKGDEALLGAVTLEVLGLVLNPFDRTLRPMRLMLA